MNRSVACVIQVAVLLGACCADPVRALAAQTATAGPAGAARGAVWDTLAAMESSSRWREADSLVTALLPTLEQPMVRDSAALARALSRQAAYRRVRGLLRDGSALGAAERAVAIGERASVRDPRQLCQMYSVLSMVLVDLGRGDRALESASRGRAIAGAMAPRDDSLLASMHLREAQAQRIRGDDAAALAALAPARDLMRAALGDSALALSAIESEIGRAYLRQGEFDRARHSLESAVRISERHFATHPDRLEIALSGVLGLERRVGHVASAVELGERILVLARARVGGDAPPVPAYASNLSYALLSLGDFPRARLLLAGALTHFAATLPPATPSLLQMRVAYASACTQLGDDVEARRQLDLVDSMLVSHPELPVWLRAYNVNVRSSLELRAGRNAEVRRRLLELAGSGPLELSIHGDLFAMLFETLTDPGDRALADSLTGSLDAFDDTTGIARVRNWPEILLGRARAEARVGERDQARDHARQADSLSGERSRWELALLTDREALMWDEAAQPAADVLIETAGADRPIEVRQAWDSVVRRRGAVRELVERRRALPASSDSALVLAHARWVEELRRHAQIVVSDALGGSDSSSQRRFDASLQRVESAERRFAKLTAAAGRPVESVTLDRVIASLEPEQTLVAFARSELRRAQPQMHAFVVSGADRTPRLFHLGDEAPIAQAVREWQAALASPPAPGASAARAAEAVARRKGEMVRRLVWDPLRAALGEAKSVQIVAAGPVLDLPWLALPSARGRYLVEEDVRVIVQPAERDLVSDARPAGAGGLLAVGDPAFDSRGARTTKPASRPRPGLSAGCTPSAPHLDSLPGARAEARGIAARWLAAAASGPAELLLGDDATEARFKELAAGQRVVHIATHGLLTRGECEQAPMLVRGVGGVMPLSKPAGRTRPKTSAPAPPPSNPSPWLGREVWLAFAGSNQPRAQAGDENEGWLTADEVVTLDLRGTERVVLSACHTGIADRWSQEAVVGMRRAFHLAGARAVIASQWAVADASTRDWMDALYASPSRSAGGAMRDAGRAVLERRRAKGLTTHPFYWAAFTVTGD